MNRPSLPKLEVARRLVPPLGQARLQSLWSGMMTRPVWRWIAGLGMVLAMIGAVQLLAWTGHRLVNPGALYAPAVLIATLISGISCGAAGTVLMMGYAYWYFGGADGVSWTSPQLLQRIAVLGLSSGITLLAVGFIRNRMLAGREQLAERVQELERIRNELRASESRLRRLVAHLPGSIFTRTMDQDGRLKYLEFLTQPRSVIGATPQQIVTDAGNVLNRIHPEDREKFLSAMRESAEKFSPYTVEYRIVRDDGTVRWLQSSATPYRLDSGAVAWDGIAIEVTEQKVHAARLQQSLRMQALGNLTQGVAHEYNNQLQIIQGGLELLEVSNPPSGKLAALFQEMRRAAEKAAAISRRLMIFAKQGDQPAQEVDANAIVEDAVHLLAGLWPSTIAIERRLEPRLPLARGDRSLLADALVSLMLNARDAMPEGGKLTIETRQCQVAQDEATVPAGTYIAIRVKDTGRGMSEEIARRAFDPFFTTRPVGQGVGLGLSLVYSFTQQAGGYVDLTSAPGKGTTVTLYLQLAAPLDPAPSQSLAR